MQSTELPQDVVSMLPADPQAQLELANKIVSFAFASKISELEHESRDLRESLIQKQGTIKTLERRVGNLESEVNELHAKNRHAAEEAHKLQIEKAALIDTVKRLNRDVAKLEAFKKNLLQHLHDDEEPVQLEPSLATVDMSSERLVSEVLQSAGKGLGAQHSTNSYGPRGSSSAGAPSSSFPPPHARTPSTHTSSYPLPGSHTNGSSGGGHGGSGGDPYSDLRPDSFGGSLTFSTGGGLSSAVRGASADSGNTDSPPPGSSSFFAPPTHHFGGGGTSSGDLTPDRAPSSGPPSAPPPVTDGKEFFRQARDRLSYEQFTQFLHNIKELNGGRQSRDNTLWKAREIFGSTNQDLYASLEGLLSRQATAF